MIRLVFVIFLIFSLSAGPEVWSQQEHDYAYNKTVKFYVAREKNGSYSLKSETQVKVKYLSERSFRQSVYTIPELYFSKVSAIKGTFKKQTLPSDKFGFLYQKTKDSFFASYKLHTISFDQNIKLCDSIQYSYKETFTDIAYVPILEIQNIDYIESYTIIVEHPTDVKTDFEIAYSKDSIPYTLERNEGKTVLTFRNIQKTNPVPYFPFSHHASLLTKFTIDNRPINPHTPQSFTNWYLLQLENKGLIRDKHDSLVQAITLGLSKPLEKLKAINDFVKTRVRYISESDSLHTIFPNPSAMVLQNGYGDCKDRALLVMLMARSAGLNVHMAIVSTEPKLPFKSVHTSLFNHMINVYEDDGTRVYFDPTAKYCEFGNLPAMDLAGPVLILNRENPVYTSEKAQKRHPSIEVTIEGSLDSLRVCKAAIKLRNEFLSAARRAQRELSGTELENYISRLVNSSFTKIGFENFKFLSEEDSVMVFSAKSELHEFVIQTSSRRYLPQAPFKVISADLNERQKDDWPVYMSEQGLLKIVLCLNIGDATISFNDISLGNERTARFTCSTRMTGSRTMMTVYEFEQVPLSYSGEDRNHFLNFCKQYLKLKTSMITINQNHP